MGVNKVVYGAVSIIDITDSTVTKETLAAGITAYGANGEKIIGEAEVVLPETGVTVAKIGNTEYKSVSTALANAVSGNTVLMVANSDESDKTLIIPSGVTLELSTFTLKAGSLIGLEGSLLAATSIKSSNVDGKLYVAKENFKMAEQCTYQYSSTGVEYSILPLYDTNLGCYRFARFEILTNNADRKLIVDNEKIKFQFKVNSTAKVLTEYISNGLTDNFAAVVVDVEWGSENGVASYRVVYNDGQVSTQTGSYDLTLTINGYNAMHVDTETLKVTAKVITDCGIVGNGQTWGVNGVIAS